MRYLPFLLFWIPLLCQPLSQAQELEHLALQSPYDSFVEANFPFFTQTLDARKFGDNPEPTNLTPRGIIVKLGDNHYGCFDPDLLRWALIWKANEQGEYLTMDGMAPGSYRLPNRKSPIGQSSLPRPIGTPIYATPALPGWAPTQKQTETDPRESAGAEEGELGLGPVPEVIGRFSGIRLIPDGVQLELKVGDQTIHEQLQAKNGKIIRTISPPSDVWHRALPAPAIEIHKEILPAKQPSRFWEESISTKPPTPGNAESTLTFDDIPLPDPNPWKRNVRLCGLDFFPDGRAALCTFDGDIWIAADLDQKNQPATWTRFASGLHEPKSVCIVENEIYVSDRNGIVRLVDTDHNGEADWYENHSHVVPQTAETREFAMDMVADGKGGFYLAKGGQTGSTRGIANGTIVHVAPGGKSYKIIATGLRQPYLGYNPATGLLTASDQQGHWRPATPIYQIESGNYYGFQPAKLKDKAVHPAPIAPPEVWIPHFINPSGASQVWVDDTAAMGALNGKLVHIGYNRPEIFQIYLHKNRQQGAVIPVLSGFPAGLLKGRIHPTDGLLYLTGFEIWGTSGDRISGLFRVRPGHLTSRLPQTIVAGKRGIFLGFPEPLEENLAKELGRYSVDRWNYQQTHNYGSGNFKLDGTPGQESVTIASVKLSTDQTSLFLGLPDMQPSHSLRLTYRPPFLDSGQVESIYLTIHELEKLDLPTLGFINGEVDLTPPKNLTGTREKIQPTARLGKETALQYGCIACHATGDTNTPSPSASVEKEAQVAVGPSWVGLWGSKRTFTDGSTIPSADETYLRESILDPGRRVTEGFETESTGVGMPSYLGVLQDHEIQSIILYIQTLKNSG